MRWLDNIMGWMLVTNDRNHVEPPRAVDPAKQPFPPPPRVGRDVTPDDVRLLSHRLRNEAQKAQAYQRRALRHMERAETLFEELVRQARGDDA